ncbi:Uncharacterised protein [Serratia marcescens]|uniref:Uncharacterized protein n=1 Tax=Serratia marcescens TaxID=615 RepID=A0A379ZN77_SERMA|nr:Uncharacterised protein [Serratia marcescens]
MKPEKINTKKKVVVIGGWFIWNKRRGKHKEAS